jgi:predicted dehydrogenase
MEKIKIAVVGCGTIANSAHLPAYQKNAEAEIRYVCDIIPERADKAAAEYGGKAVYDYKELLGRSDIDAVSICTPNNVHAPIAIDFLRAGKDVLSEKPAARTYAEAVEMKKAQAETGRVLNIGVCNRFNTSVNRIKAHIDAGELGEVYHVYLSFRSHRSIPGLGGAFTTKAVAGGGALIDWGVHFLDLVMYCTGDPTPLTVSGQAFSKLGKDIPGYTCTGMWAGPRILGGVYDVEDSVAAFIRTAGPAFTLHGAWAQNIGEDEMYVDFIGDKAGIRLQYGADYTLYSAKDGALLTVKPAFSSENMYEVEIAHFLDCVRTRKPSPASIDNALITSRIMQAIYDSSEVGREIVLEG